MNYNNFNGYGGYSNGRYFSSPSYVPNYQQNYVQPQNYVQQPMNQDQNNGLFFNHIRYATSEEMDKYLVNLGNTDMLINLKDGLVKILSADMAGNSFSKLYSIKEIDNPSKLEEKKEELDLSGFVKKEDLNDFIKVDALTQFSKQLDEKFDKLEKKIKISEIMGEK